MRDPARSENGLILDKKGGYSRTNLDYAVAEEGSEPVAVSRSTDARVRE